MGNFRHGEPEDLGDFCVWWYEIPARSGGKATRWAYAWRSRDGAAWIKSAGVSGFEERIRAVEAAMRRLRLRTLPEQLDVDTLTTEHIQIWWGAGAPGASGVDMCAALGAPCNSFPFGPSAEQTSAAKAKIVTQLVELRRSLPW